MPVLAQCPFCGREIIHKRSYGLNIPIPCQCDGAREERARLDLEERRANWRDTYAKALSRANIPSAYSHVRSWGDGNSSYLYGKQGRGKTESACGALRKWLKDGIKEYGEGSNRFFAARSGRYVLMPEWMMQIRSTYNGRAATEEQIIQSTAGVGMLVMDELGKGKMTDWVVERISIVLEMRNRAKDRLRTVITTQYDLDRLTSIFEAASDEETALAIRSRIEGMCEIVHFGGTDMRLNKDVNV